MSDNVIRDLAALHWKVRSHVRSLAQSVSGDGRVGFIKGAAACWVDTIGCARWNRRHLYSTMLRRYLLAKVKRRLGTLSRSSRWLSRPYQITSAPTGCRSRAAVVPLTICAGSDIVEAIGICLR